jgi:hypothetical protein
MHRTYHSLAALVLAASTFAAHALPVIEYTSFITTRWGPSTIFPRLGEFLQFDTAINSIDPPQLLSAVASQGASHLNLSFYTEPIIGEKNFGGFLADTNLTGAWNLTVTDSSGSSYGTFRSISNPQILPLMLDVHVTGAGVTPTVSWTLPDLTGYSVDAVSVRATVARTGVQTFQSTTQSPLVTSFTVPEGVLQPGVSYEFRVMLDNYEGLRLENRSNTFSPVYTPAIPEPGTLGLLLAGLTMVVGVSVLNQRR